ncbi:hypothetical protein [Roseateles sp. BYS96W]|uniref:Uncharacterized protein n=1 Tax=Pelomonas nitida TaxID=3299027 RepID=A0ABW7G5U9_9BURK
MDPLAENARNGCLVSNSGSPSIQQGASSKAAEEAKAAGFDYYLNSSSTVELTYLSEDSAEWKAIYEINEKTKVAPLLAADDNIRIIEDRLKKFQKNLSLSRPDLAKADWDVTIKDGKLQVTGDVAADDKKVMETRLNQDRALVNAVNSYMSAAKTYLETSDLNPAFTTTNAYTGRAMLYNFEDVGAQLDGKVNFKQLIEASWRMYDNPWGGENTDPGRYRGASSFDILASHLTSTPQS